MPNPTWRSSVIVEIFANNLLSQPFLGCHLGFNTTSCTLFKNWAVFGLDEINYRHMILIFEVAPLLCNLVIFKNTFK